MPYVSRIDGVVVGTYATKQPGIAEEYLADDDPEILARKGQDAAGAYRDRATEAYNLFQQKMNAPYIWNDGANDHPIQMDSGSQDAITKASLRMRHAKSQNVPAMMNWVMADNSRIDIDRDDFLDMASEVYDFGKDLFDILQDHKDALRDILGGAGTDAEKIAAIQAYDINLNW